MAFFCGPTPAFVRGLQPRPCLSGLFAKCAVGRLQSRPCHAIARRATAEAPSQTSVAEWLVCRRRFAETLKRSRPVSAHTRLLRAGRPRARSPHGSDFVPQAGYKAAFMPRLGSKAARKPPRCSRGLSDRRASSKPRAQPPQAASAGAVNLKVGGNHATLSLPPAAKGVRGKALAPAPVRGAERRGFIYGAGLGKIKPSRRAP